MSADIVLNGNDLNTTQSLIYKAQNILETQLNYLVYAPNFGIDYDLFINQSFDIQTETFKSYAISKLAENGINPVDVLSMQNELDSIINIKISN